MATFVLVPGFWLGGWVWRDVTDALRAKGHTVFPVTLTGVGERVHLATEDIDMDTHVTDVVNLMRYEDLNDVLLVGHSYAGNVITGVADQSPERIARLVYVDTWPLPNGVAMSDLGVPKVRGEHGGLVMPSWEDMDEGNELAGLGDAERRFLRERAVDQPYGSVTQPAHWTNPARLSISRTAIWCSQTVEQVNEMIAQYPQVTSTLAEPGWQVLELPTGHWPMVSRPTDLAEILAGLA